MKGLLRIRCPGECGSGGCGFAPWRPPCLSSAGGTPVTHEFPGVDAGLRRLPGADADSLGSHDRLQIRPSRCFTF
jgi:hypothetical protein